MYLHNFVLGYTIIATCMEITIDQRLKALPATEYRAIRDQLRQRTKVHPNTISNTLHGKGRNLEVLQTLAAVLGCTVDNVLDPTFPFPATYSHEQTRKDIIRIYKLTAE